MLSNANAALESAPSQPPVERGAFVVQARGKTYAMLSGWQIGFYRNFAFILEYNVHESLYHTVGLSIIKRLTVQLA